MTTRDQKTIDPQKQGTAQATASLQRGAANDDICRCKATSLMRPRQLLGLMWSDLAFWKKTRKG